jgi:hypothetical protein
MLSEKHEKYGRDPRSQKNQVQSKQESLHEMNFKDSQQPEMFFMIHGTELNIL